MSVTHSYQFEPAVQVVKAKFPDVRHVGDVRRLAMPAIREEIDLIVGGFPCQDLSCLGKREGLAHYTSLSVLIRITKSPMVFTCESAGIVGFMDHGANCFSIWLQ